MDKEELRRESENSEWWYRVTMNGVWEDFKTLPEVYDYITKKHKRGIYVSIRNIAIIEEKENAKTTTENTEQPE